VGKVLLVGVVVAVEDATDAPAAELHDYALVSLARAECLPGGASGEVVHEDTREPGCIAGRSPRLAMVPERLAIVVEDVRAVEPSGGGAALDDGEVRGAERYLLGALVLSACGAEPHRPAAEVDVAPFA